MTQSFSLDGLAAAMGDAIHIATPADMPRLLEFSSSVEMGAGGLNLQYDRAPDYFRYLEYQGVSPQVLWMASSGCIDGIASTSIRKAFVDGRLERIAYWSGLRIHSSRSASRLWRRTFVEIIRICRENHAIRYHPMAILADNKLALKALTHSLGKEVTADLVYPYQIAQILTPLPFRRRARLPAGLRLVRASELAAEDLIQFLDAQQRRKAFGFPFAGGEWAHRQGAWDGLSLADFLVWIDGENRVLATCCPWDPSSSKEVMLHRLPAKLKMLAGLGNLLGFPYGLAPVWEKRPFRPLYLTHLDFHQDLEADLSAELLRGFVEEVFATVVKKRPRRWNCLSLMDASDGRMTASLSGYVTQTTPAQLISVRHREESALPQAEDANGFRLPVGLEIALA